MIRRASALLVLAPLLAACSPASAPEPQRTAVLVREITEQQASALEIYSGEVRARHAFDASFRVSGKLVERRVGVGDRVSRGTLLARLDAEDLRLSAAAANDRLVAAIAQAGLARSELERTSRLVARGFVSASLLDTRRAALDAAEATADQARAELALATNRMAYAQLTAEGDAVVVATHLEPGEFVEAGKPVLRLAGLEQREVVVHLPEGRIGAISPGMPASVAPLADPQRRYRAVVRELAAAADPATRTFEARLAVANADRFLPLGASAVAAFAPGAAAHPILPLPAVVQVGGRSIVWQVDDTGTARAVEVGVRELREDGVLVGSGLRPGMRVVVAGANRLSEGQPLRAVPERAPLPLDIGR